ncbi:MAG: DUF2950 family protein [Reyranella sp.]|nr:MAG: DUF2950 family protein [Reyranella sp.]
MPDRSASRASGAWHFDAQAGLMEVLFRRIGENEAMAIQASKALAAADRQESSPWNGADAHGSNPMPSYGCYFRVLTP